MYTPSIDDVLCCHGLNLQNFSLRVCEERGLLTQQCIPHNMDVFQQAYKDE